MLFCSYPYILFLLITLVGLRLTEKRPEIQGILLLVASNFFYGFWDVRFLALIWYSTVLSFSVGVLLDKYRKERTRRLLLCVGIIGNLSVLIFFKYFDFFQNGAADLLSRLGIPYDPWLLGIIVPVGISFYTFQTLSYTIDVYRKVAAPCTDLFHFAGYVMYFPQLVAGPIERASHLLPQLKGPWLVRAPNLMSGGLLIVWGFFKKAVVGDIAGIYMVDPVFKEPLGGLHLWLASMAFAVQIYADFSGYCDIARGTARCMGVELVDNFNAPYWASNIAEFWRRWHISLSQWFRDYVYIPLGGSHLGPAHTLLNLAITMALCGLWHGASVSFILWGLYHGALLVAHRIVHNTFNRDSVTRGVIRQYGLSAAKVVLTYLLVTYGWMVFRIDDAAMIPHYTMMMLHPLEGPDHSHYWTNSQKMGVSLLILAVPIMTAHWLQIRANRFGDEIEEIFHRFPYLLGFTIGVMIIIIMLFGTLGDNLPFIYFQF